MGIISTSSRQELLISKTKKRLQESNANLEKLGAELDEERTKLARALGEFGLGQSFEVILHDLANNLTELEEASVEFSPQILAYSKRLERLEAEVCRSLFAHPVTSLIQFDRSEISRKSRSLSERRVSRLLGVRK